MGNCLLHLKPGRIYQTMDKNLLISYIEGNATDQQKVIITQWLDTDPEHMREYLALRKLHDITLWQEAPLTGRAHKPRKPAGLLKRLSIEALKIAAVLALAFFAFQYFFTTPQPEEPIVMQTLHVPAGQRAELTLVDGTSVWLNANTTLTFPNRFSAKTREVQLRGEGYFDVLTDKTKPFKVRTADYDVKVWGTEFNVMAWPGQGIFETALLEGSVEVMYSGDDKGVFIEPDQRIFLKNGRTVRGPIKHYNHFLWKEGIISFDNESFPEMVKKLELYFDLDIQVKNDNLMKYHCTGKFRTKDGVEHILKVLQLSNDFSFKIDDKENLITIK